MAGVLAIDAMADEAKAAVERGSGVEWDEGSSATTGALTGLMSAPAGLLLSGPCVTDAIMKKR